MKTTKTFIALLLMIFISGASLAQNNQKESKVNQRTFTGITGQAIKESSEVNNVEKLIEEISNEIYKEKLVAADAGSLSYMLNNKEFIINGVVQKPEIHLRYMNKYIKKNTKWNICKNYKIK
ncbi:hypothetical protein L1276_003665 [Flavobacterium sp. HSC-32F16]|uniref:hypothetical protein n=1 Tax=Flavobacterium sp. HSC-32F16 TaxID=2910964 RepID=UPI0020A60949|nr:hypothetical protein [Flavobacterium sp. HSC-32F16]MCP2028495.1 hypothetical protein [Flavobacterium sp. HSC-32F16]